MPLLDRIDPLAKHIGAVNTVIKLPNGTLEGRNSDGFGFLEALKQGAPRLAGDSGTGDGAGRRRRARAVVATLVVAGVPELRLVNRTQSSAIDLGVAFTPNDGRRIAIDRWDERDDALDGATLLVNTTSLGMKGQPPLEIDVARLPATAIVDDIVYVPLETRLGHRPRARPALHRRARHAAASGPAGLRGVVRPEGGRERRTAPCRRG